MMKTPKTDAERTKKLKDSITECIVKAEDMGYWFYAPTLNLWLTPDELAVGIEKGLYLWHPRFWQLRDPKHLLDSWERQAEDLDKKIAPLKKKLEEYKPKIKVDKIKT